MDFGMAIVALKRGNCVARKGWNGKGMFLTLQEGSVVSGNNMRNEGAKKYYADCKCKIASHIDMKSADGTYVVGWLASQTDMLAEDWEIVEPTPMKEEIHLRS
jgi:hypothetical protein